jgi:predicted transcriptional regulator
MTCFEHGYKVTEVAEVLGVTKAMVYLWFYGTFEPSKEKAVAVKKLIKRIEQMSNRGSTTPCQQESSS